MASRLTAHSGPGEALGEPPSGGHVLGGRYRLMAPVGLGTSSRVHLAVDTQLRRRVAVKLLHEALAEDRAFLRRFRAEARAAGALNHPNILAVFDWGEDDPGDGSVVPYLVTEYLGGGSLRTMLDAAGTLTPSQALVVGLDAARALAHAHQRGLVHRDVKPANLLFDEERRLRLADFGLARALAEASWTEPSGVAVGTARYASPEQAMGRRLDGRSDVYSLALVLVECVTGTVPFAADTTAATLALRTRADLELGVEFGGLRSILERAGRLDPAERPDAAELEIGLMAAAEALERPDPLPIVPTLGDGERTSEFLVRPGDDGIASIEVVDLRTTAPGPEPEAEPGAPGARTDDHDTDAQDSAAKDTDGPPAVDADAELEPSASPDPRPAEDPPLVRDPIAVAEEHELLVAARPASFGPLVDPADPGRDARSPRRRGRLRSLLVALLVVGLFGGGVAAWWFLVRVPTHEVPVLTGQQVDAATATAEGLGFVVDASTLDRADGTEPGEVLAQDPAAGVELAEGETVRLVVSLGPTLTDVPDVVGLPEAEAFEALGAAGLVVGEPGSAFDEEVPAGHVVSVAPAEGSPEPDGSGRLPKGTEVALVVSQGPAPRAVPGGLQGARVEDAVAALEAVQLVAVQNRTSYSEVVPAGYVISVSEPAGTELPRGAEVVLEVSRGPAPIAVPDVRYDTGTRAVAVLESSGFTVAGIEGSPSGMVLATDPPPGELHQRGTAVRIFTRS